MHYFRIYGKAITRVLTLCIVSTGVYISGAQAALVDTPTLIAAEQERAKVATFMERDDVRRALIAQGVDIEQARARVAGLNDREIREMAGRIDELPAGGDVVGAAVFVFIVLLITDIAGLTDIFPFVRKPEER